MSIPVKFVGIAAIAVAVTISCYFFSASSYEGAGSLRIPTVPYFNDVRWIF